MREFWREGLFGPLDERYFRLVNRANDIENEIDWDALDMRGVFERYQAIFNNQANVRKEAYLDSMTHFDFKCLLPALLQVEDRMSMAHGLESRARETVVSGKRVSARVTHCGRSRIKQNKDK